MAVEVKPFQIPELKWDECDPSQFVLDYDRKTDRLHVIRQGAQHFMSLDVDDELWVRFDPDTGEIVGFEVEDFKRIFLKRNPELHQSWAKLEPQLNASWTRIRHRRNNEKLATAAALLLEYIKRLLLGDGPRTGLINSAI